MVRTAWLRRTASYGVAAIMACFGLTSVVSAQTITNTGPGSHNNITSNQTNNCRIMNNNDLSVYNRNNQYATTGNVTESGNTGVGLTWSGWDALNPTAAQASGQSYASWWSGVVNWIAQRAGGTGWNSNESNLTWTPGSTDWTAYNPSLWQAQGQSFANWYNAVESYLNANSSNWVLSWPATDTGTGSFGATSGNATNNYNANFSININNAARAAAGMNACGQSLFTPPATGGSGGGGSLPSGGSSGVVLGSSFAPASRPTGGGGEGGSGGFVGGSVFIPTSHVSRPALPSSSVPNTSPVISTPTGGGGEGGGAPAPAPAASISNTGPGSSNNITSNQTNNSSVTNCNTVTVSSTSTQVATTGSSNVSDNTTAGGGGSGNATNTGSSGTGVGISN